MNETQIQKMMKSLSISREEAIDLIQEDEEVNRMTVKQAESDLTADQKQAIKKASGTGKRKTTYEFKPRAKKKDENKIAIISGLEEFLQKNYKNVEILNENREISFDFGDENYSVTLTKHRKPTK